MRRRNFGVSKWTINRNTLSRTREERGRERKKKERKINEKERESSKWSPASNQITTAPYFDRKWTKNSKTPYADAQCR